MIWLAVLFAGLAVADLAHAIAVSRPWWLSALLGVVAQVAVVLLTLRTPADAVALTVAAAVVVAWRRVHREAPATVTRAGLALAVGAVPTVALLAASGLAGPVSGPLPAWLSGLHLLGLDHSPPGRVLLLGAVLLLNLATGNVVVRDVLVIAGRPALDNAQALAELAAADAQETDGSRDGADADAAGKDASASDDDAPADASLPAPLRGGRILGPMERLLIVGLGSWGNLTAAAIVVAAKGLLRFPELNQASKSADRTPLDEITEYVLIGTLASILFALATLALAS